MRTARTQNIQDKSLILSDPKKIQIAEDILTIMSAHPNDPGLIDYAGRVMRRLAEGSTASYEEAYNAERRTLRFMGGLDEKTG